MMRRGVFIIPYFGKLPYYFPLWMRTATYSKCFDFWIFTNDNSIKSTALNVKIICLSFEDFVNNVQLKFDFKIGLTTPRKLCDFRPAYGYIFEENISQYDYWGFCDIDLLWGDIDHLVPLEEGYDKLYVHGHMTLMKNTAEMNRLFMYPIDGFESYQTILSSEKNKIFDESTDGLNINLIAKSKGIKVYFDYQLADINPFSFLFRIAQYDYSLPCKKGRSVVFPPKRKILFYWKNGSLTKYELLSKDKIEISSVRYFHFQKRDITILPEVINANSFIIIPNKVIPYEGEITSNVIDEKVRDTLIYPKFYKLKFSSLKKKLHAK